MKGTEHLDWLVFGDRIMRAEALSGDEADKERRQQLEQWPL